MPTHKLNWIKKIQVKSSKHASNKMGQNLSRKTAAVKRIFLLGQTFSEKFVKIRLIEDEKLQLQLKFQVNWSYRKKNEKSNSAQTWCRNKIS